MLIGGAPQAIPAPTGWKIDAIMQLDELDMPLSE